MKISINSWHYRLMGELGLRIPYNLCAYFWKTVWALLLSASLVVVSVYLTVAASMPFWWWVNPSADALPLVIFVGTIDVAILAVVLVTVIRDRHYTEMNEGTRPWPSQEPQKEPGLLILWLRAKKEKLCPFIDFE